MCGSCLEVLSPRRKSFLSSDLGQKENLETRGSSDSAGRAGQGKGGVESQAQMGRGRKFGVEVVCSVPSAIVPIGRHRISNSGKSKMREPAGWRLMALGLPGKAHDLSKGGNGRLGTKQGDQR